MMLPTSIPPSIPLSILPIRPIASKTPPPEIKVMQQHSGSSTLPPEIKTVAREFLLTDAMLGRDRQPEVG